VPGRVDDPNIGPDEILWRRVSPDKILPTTRSDAPPPSNAFRSNAVEISVNRASLCSVEATLQDYPNDSLVAVTAGAVRAAECIVVSDPKIDNPAHTLIIGKRPDGILTKSECKKIANCASWIVFRSPHNQPS
jgi:hypothetical protein